MLPGGAGLELETDDGVDVTVTVARVLAEGVDSAAATAARARRAVRTYERTPIPSDAPTSAATPTQSTPRRAAAGRPSIIIAPLPESNAFVALVGALAGPFAGPGHCAFRPSCDGDGDAASLRKAAARTSNSAPQRSLMRPAICAGPTWGPLFCK